MEYNSVDQKIIDEYVKFKTSRLQLRLKYKKHDYQIVRLLKQKNVLLRGNSDARTKTPQQRFDFIVAKHPKLSITKEFLFKNYIIEKKSLPELKKEFGLNYSETPFLLKFFNIAIRTIQESKLLEKTQNKFKKTCIDKYGVNNPSKSAKIKKKKEKTFLKNYGVDNLWKDDDFKKNLNNFYIQKYGISRSEFLSNAGRNTWKNKSPTEKMEWLDKSIRSETSLQKLFSPRKGYITSSLETKIASILDLLNYNYERQFPIYFQRDDKKCRKHYDFFIKELNLIIEVNGDYWHANPSIYTANDLLHYRFAKITAKDIWERDRIKQKLALDNKYKLLIIWEKDINKKSEKQLIKFLKKKLNEFIQD